VSSDTATLRKLMPVLKARASTHGITEPVGQGSKDTYCSDSSRLSRAKWQLVTVRTEHGSCAELKQAVRMDEGFTAWCCVRVNDIPAGEWNVLLGEMTVVRSRLLSARLPTSTL